jgi:hypothetical protein
VNSYYLLFQCRYILPDVAGSNSVSRVSTTHYFTIHTQAYQCSFKIEIYGKFFLLFIYSTTNPEAYVVQFGNTASTTDTVYCLRNATLFVSKEQVRCCKTSYYLFQAVISTLALTNCGEL